MKRFSAPRLCVTILIVLMVLDFSSLCPFAYGLLPCANPPHQGGVGDPVFANVSATFVGSDRRGGGPHFDYHVSIDLDRPIEIPPGGMSRVIELYYGTGTGMSAYFLWCYVENEKTHYESSDGDCLAFNGLRPYASIPVSAFSGQTLPITTVYNDVCLGPSFTVAAGVLDNTESCDSIDNDANGYVDDVGGVQNACQAQAVPVCSDSLDCAPHVTDACADVKDSLFPHCGQTFDSHFGFEQKTLPLITTASPGLPLNFSLQYNNRNEASSAIPGRWATNYDIGLNVVSASLNGTIVEVRWPDGSRSRYSATSGTILNGLLSDGSFVQEFVSSGYPTAWDLHYRDGLIYHFSSVGVLQSIADGKGNTLTIGHTSSSNPTAPTTISDNYGHTIPSLPICVRHRPPVSLV